MQVLEDSLSNLYDSGPIPYYTVFNTLSIAELKQELKDIILETNINTNQINELLSTKYADIECDDKIRTFISILENNKRRLLFSALVHHNCAFGETLHTFDWKLKFVCGTSELKTLSYPLLQLNLFTVTENHEPSQKLYEVNKDMLARLIGVLETVVNDDNKELK